jgi:hypothetical protein
MKVAMMQPLFMPWQGFFELIYQSERFVFLDDYQFVIQSHHQRNLLFSNIGKTDWYTVPVQKSISFKMPFNQVRILEKIPWRVKMWKRLQQNYFKTAYYGEIAPLIENWLQHQTESLAENNINFIILICNILNVQREFRFSSQFQSKTPRSAKVLELLRWCEADYYYCAKGSFDYMLADGVFPVDDIEIFFQDFKPKPYKQIGSPDTFVPYLSVLDALMNIGPSPTMQLIRNGTEKWLTWDERMDQKRNRDIHE